MLRVDVSVDRLTVALATAERISRRGATADYAVSVATYEFESLGIEERLIERVTLRQHDRRQSAWALVEKIARLAQGKEEDAVQAALPPDQARWASAEALLEMALPHVEAEDDDSLAHMIRQHLNRWHAPGSQISGAEFEQVNLADPGRTWLGGNRCHAVQHADRTICKKCNFSWDTNDRDRPRCEQPRIGSATASGQFAEQIVACAESVDSWPESQKPRRSRFSEQPDTDGWTKHDGGRRPAVTAGRPTELKLRSGREKTQTAHDPHGAWWWNWRGREEPEDIVAWRRVPDPLPATGGGY